MTHWQNRIVGEGVEDGDQLLANPANWRIHPKHQQDALAGVLESVGWVQRVIVNKRTGFVVDGHMRVALAITHGEQVPVSYVDLSEDEEQLILATFDPISALAGADAGKLDELLQSVNTDNAAIQEMLENLASEVTPIKVSFAEGERGYSTDEKLDVFMNATIKQVVLYFQTDEYLKVLERLQAIKNASPELENHTLVFLRLLEHYEATAL